jgi:hypothetical protein
MPNDIPTAYGSCGASDASPAYFSAPANAREGRCFNKN